ncbi:phytanoyl-CoA dioxygenase family protein [Pedobacter fastidiosus]|uniref:Phytanoyl-CoA dioxygenase family protein n=1 Tax=Pedobacter fastidiosus TaxID=2765361 RepID=A0ABR7KN69_9SPHI|nr:phytanoyl-CoA dioxygenase family protein [Pedobacter fastidiosus]MBC6109178.1 phytanoyl-CoA dioxygenase family protein [Pedobacter fastidiosus]
MSLFNKIKALERNGFTTVEEIYTQEEVETLLMIIESVDTTKDVFRKSEDLFAIRQFLKEVPEVIGLIFNNRLKDLIVNLFSSDYFLVKSIYFDKPESSNWFVSYHQDLTISVNKKIELEGFGPYTHKQNQFAVQPPIHILEDNFTIRIHLDDTDEQNGALKVIPESQSKGIYRADTINWKTEKEESCCVKKGGLMIMRPLLLHSSSRTINNKRRRVIHLEFSRQHLPEELQWSEYFQYQ